MLVCHQPGGLGLVVCRADGWTSLTLTIYTFVLGTFIQFDVVTSLIFFAPNPTFLDLAVQFCFIEMGAPRRHRLHREVRNLRSG